MKFLLSALFTILAIIGLGQSHQFPNFGKGPLHEDFQDILDLLPMKRIVRVARDYLAHDPEVQEAVKFLANTPVLKNLLTDLENISEVINLLNYLQEEGVESYNLINKINRAAGIKELVPPVPTPTTSTSTSTPTSSPSPTPTSTPTPTSSPTPTPTPTSSSSSTPTPTSSSSSKPTPTSSSTPRSTPTSTPSSTPTPTADLTPEPTPVSYNVMRRRTGGLAGLFKDVKDLLNYDDFISLYVDKLRYSSAFNNLLNELRSNSQEIVNRLSESESFQIIVTRLKNRNVNLKIVADVLYIVLDVTIPGRPKTLEEEFVDFAKLLPLEQISDLVLKYVNEDEGVQKAILFMFKPEFHDLLRAVEGLQEYQEFVVFLENAGVHIIENIQAFHKAIGMEDYVPPKIESFLKSQIKKQEVGGGMTAMIWDIYTLLPYEKIDALFQEKLNTSKVFAKFVSQVLSQEFKNILINLSANETFLQFITKSNEQGLDLVGLSELSTRIIGLK